ncbi:MAG: phenylalanine--tRNA ligase subunit beta [Candidatus Buchananbacteria bacterium]|nr:phenylalanine--tRNA ligase subunit beta [Candidatus Buchananbacteria bacterium]
MDRKISYNWLKEYVKLNATVEEFAKEFSLCSQSVERVKKIQAHFSGVVTAKIIAIVKHPNADRLQLATVDTGKEKITVVCGAPNIAVGQIVPLAKVGAELIDPKVDDKFVLEKGVIRGVESAGMICAPDELGFWPEHNGILVLESDTPVGKDLADVLKLDDYLMDIEITTNRPDAGSLVGLAREAAAVFDVDNKIDLPKPNLKLKTEIPLSVEVKESKLCPRYQAVVMENIKVGPSPFWLQWRLSQAGIRPINNLVDITNYILLEFGQPMHVFDYDKLQGQKIVVRKAKAGEKILALDGKNYQLSADNLVIADAKDPVAVAGVMGGELSAVSAETKTIVFEAANFNPVSVRKTARALNLYSESSSLFEKNLSAEGTFVAILRAVELTQQLAGGQTASPIIDVYAQNYKPKKISFDPANIKRLLGVEIKIKQIKNILERLGFEVSGSNTLKITVPWYRANDVEYDHDIVEEVARIYGYHNLPVELPSSEIPVRAKNPILVWEDKIKDILVGAGLTETYNYSMVDKEMIEAANRPKTEVVKISNPLNSEIEFMRTDLEPQILQGVADNIKRFNQIEIFEVSNVYRLQKANDLPVEQSCLAGAVVDKMDDFLQVKGLVELLLDKLAITDYQFKELVKDNNYCSVQTALTVVIKNEVIGYFGLVNQKNASRFSFDRPVAIFSFVVEKLAKYASDLKPFVPIAEFPNAQRDLAIVIDAEVKWQMIVDAVKSVDPLVSEIKYLSTYVDKSLGEDKKSLAFRVTFQAERTLKSEEVDVVLEKIIKNLQTKLNAILR